MKYKTLILFFPLLMCSCSMSSEDKNISFLNYYYRLNSCGTIGNNRPMWGEVLNRLEGYVDYTKLFDAASSYINFKCVGTSFDDFKCETTFYLKDKKGNVLIDLTTPFYTTYYGNQRGTIIFENKEIGEKLGTMYVYTPYWVRWQFDYEIENGEKQKLTFEFWKKEKNELPDFVIV